MSKLNFYELLNASANATFEELKASYKQLILQCHPDKLSKDSCSGISAADSKAYAAAAVAANTDPNVDEQKFIDINEAWQTLKDPVKRKLYDAELMLTKFQTHQNIFGRLTLNDMVRQKLLCPTDVAAKTEVSAEAISTQSAAVNNVDEREAQIEWCYTHACRCGGQYTIDESALNEIFSDANKATDSSSSCSRRNNNKNTNITHFVDEKQKNSNINGIESCVYNNDDNECDNDNDHDDADDADYYNDNDGEIMVECSECSLVIIVKRSEP